MIWQGIYYQAIDDRILRGAKSCIFGEGGLLRFDIGSAPLRYVLFGEMQESHSGISKHVSRGGLSVRKTMNFQGQPMISP